MSTLRHNSTSNIPFSSATTYQALKCCPGAFSAIPDFTILFSLTPPLTIPEPGSEVSTYYSHVHSFRSSMDLLFTTKPPQLTGSEYRLNGVLIMETPSAEAEVTDWIPWFIKARLWNKAQIWETLQNLKDQSTANLTDVNLIWKELLMP